MVLVILEACLYDIICFMSLYQGDAKIKNLMNDTANNILDTFFILV